VLSAGDWLGFQAPKTVPSAETGLHGAGTPSRNLMGRGFSVSRSRKVLLTKTGPRDAEPMSTRLTSVAPGVYRVSSLDPVCRSQLSRIPFAARPTTTLSRPAGSSRAHPLTESPGGRPTMISWFCQTARGRQGNIPVAFMPRLTDRPADETAILAAGGGAGPGPGDGGGLTAGRRCDR
jgi:hypothetical protein